MKTEFNYTELTKLEDQLKHSDRIDLDTRISILENIVNMLINLKNNKNKTLFEKEIYKLYFKGNESDFEAYNRLLTLAICKRLQSNIDINNQLNF